LLLELIEVDRVLSRGHLHGQSGIVVLARAGKEAVHLLFTGEDEGVILEFDYEQAESLLHFAFILEGYWAVTLDSLFLVNHLRGFVGSDAHGSVSLRGEDDLLGEDAGVVQEDLLHGSISEVVELVAVKHTEVRSVSTRDEHLVHFP